MIYEKQGELFKNKSTKSNKSYQIHTITFIDALHRIIVLYDEYITESNFEAFRNLNNLRNSLTHHEIDLESKEIGNIIASTLPFVLSVFKKNLDNFEEFMLKKDINSNIDNLYYRNLSWEFETIFNTLGNLKTLKLEYSKMKSNGKKYKEKVNIIKAESKNKYSLIECPSCGEKFFQVEGLLIKDSCSVGNFGTCMLCGFQSERDLIVLKNFENSGINDIETFIHTKCNNILYSYNYYYGNLSDNDMENTVLNNKEAFKECLINCINDYVIIMLDFLDENSIEVIEELDDDKDDILIKSFDLLSPYERVIFINMRVELYQFTEIYIAFFGEKLEVIDCEKIFKNVKLKYNYNSLLKLYINWLNYKRDFSKWYKIIEENEELQEIIRTISYSVSDGEIWLSLDGTEGSKLGIIDTVDVDFIELEYIERFNEFAEFSEIIAIFYVQIETESCIDHELIPNGSDEIYVEAILHLYEKDNELELYEHNLVGP